MTGLEFMLNYIKGLDVLPSECKINVTLLVGLCRSHERRTMAEIRDRLLYFGFILCFQEIAFHSLTMTGWGGCKSLSHLIFCPPYIVSVNPEGDDLLFERV